MWNLKSQTYLKKEENGGYQEVGAQGIRLMVFQGANLSQALKSHRGLKYSILNVGNNIVV